MHPNLSDIAGSLIGLANKIIPALVLFGLVAFIWLCVRYVIDSGEGGAKRREAILWGIIALVVMVSFWAILNVLCATFLPGGSC